MDIGLLAYPRHAPLDLIGPWEILRRLPESRMHLVWTRPGPVQTEGGIELCATVAFADAPALDLLLVPGGPGQLALMRHSLLLDYLRSCADNVDWMCGVCTGSLLLAQAGLLREKRATTHWLARDALRSFGVEVGEERYVIDGKFATCASCTAGIDLALELARRLVGEGTAREIQLEAAYDPAPALAGGTPDTAPPELVRRVRTGSRRFR